MEVDPEQPGGPGAVADVPRDTGDDEEDPDQYEHGVGVGGAEGLGDEPHAQADDGNRCQHD